MSNKPYILIAEDDFSSQIIFEDILSEYYTVKIEENGQYFFETFKTKAPDLVILDINMPIMDGIETCKLLRDYEQYDHIPIILASAQASLKITSDCGATDFILKPFTDIELLQLVKKYLA